MSGTLSILQTQIPDRIAVHLFIHAWKDGQLNAALGSKNFNNTIDLQTTNRGDVANMLYI